MKVLLLKPPLTSFKPMHMPPTEPLGLMYLAGFLRDKGKDVSILDASVGGEFRNNDGLFTHGLTDASLRDHIIRLSPDVVGISCMFTVHSKGPHNAAKVVKDISRDILVVFGGAHASALPQCVLRDNNVDLIVKGEGEQTLLEIIENIEKSKGILTEIPGTIIRLNGKIKQNKIRPFIDDLDQIPLPARDMLDMKPYYYEKYQLEHSMFPPRATMVTSRGCPYNCSYCSIHSLWRHKYRARSPHNVIEEIEYLKKEYNINEIAFMDDNISFDKERMTALCDELIEKDVNIKWSTPNGIAIWRLDEEIIKKSKESGCYKLTFGIETGSRRTQKFIRKSYIDLERTKQLIIYCNKIGLWTLSAFILGFPFETKEDIEETIRYSIECDVDMATYFIATPYPGTELFDIYRNEGLLPDISIDDFGEWVATVSQVAYDTVKLSKEEIQNLKTTAEKRFYRSRFISFLNPLRLTRKIRSREDIKYFLKMLKMRLGLWLSVEKA